tara:strand:- start:1147 stop:1929 length:783 start_codon:yes stop_codon:yes gene_type:complete
MKKKDILNKLSDDESYYGEFGKKYFSYSDINTLINEPENFKKPVANNINFVLGGYFHTAILEPHKLNKFTIVKSSSRNTNIYKELSGGEICMLQQEADMIDLMKDKTMNNDYVKQMITGAGVEYEVPNIGEIEGYEFKCKADVVNHDEKIVFDLKTTSKDLDQFKWSAKSFYYNSQAYVYSKLFGYEFVFIAVKKPTIKEQQQCNDVEELMSKIKIGVFDCSSDFLAKGLFNIQDALENYKLYYETPNFKPNNYFKTETL